jgi:hypothetical protein
MLVLHGSDSEARPAAVSLQGAELPLHLPHGYVGPVQLSGSGRMIWWTGRVAIGLRHEPAAGSVAAAAATTEARSPLLN